jgi:hypothetical protein
MHIVCGAHSASRKAFAKWHEVCGMNCLVWRHVFCRALVVELLWHICVALRVHLSMAYQLVTLFYAPSAWLYYVYGTQSNCVLGPGNYPPVFGTPRGRSFVHVYTAGGWTACTPTCHDDLLT